MADTLEIRLDPGNEFKGQIAQYYEILRTANKSAAAHIRDGLRSIIMSTYENAVAQAGEGFHPIYEHHLRQGLFSNFDPVVYATDTQLVAEIFDIQSLGDYSDLEEGFHRHALEDPIQPDGTKFSLTVSVVDLPYTGQALYNDDDPDARFEFWRAVVDGDSYEVQTKGKGGYTFTIPTEGLYEETLQNRVEVWGDRYPEWLLLEYGTPYYPEIPPTHFKYFIEQRCYEYMEEVWQAEFDSLVDAWNNTRGLGYGEAVSLSRENPAIFEPRGTGSRLRDPKSGRFVKGG